jgi:hypothetical protein
VYFEGVLGEIRIIPKKSCQGIYFRQGYKEAMVAASDLFQIAIVTSLSEKRMLYALRKLNKNKGIHIDATYCVKKDSKVSVLED